MTNIEQIERSIETLPDDKFDTLAEWFDALRSRRWEGKFDADVEAGRLDALAEEALADFRAGRTRPL